MTEVVVALGVAAGAVSAVRWLRVAQVEHYLAGSCVRTLWRWVRVRPPNHALAAVAAVAAGVAAGAGAADASFDAAVALVALAAATALPFPMSVLGRTHRLRPTRRLLTLACTVVAVAVGAAVALATGTGAAAALAVVVACLPLLVDLATWALRPLEDALARRWRRRAVARLRAVRPRVVAVTGSYGKTSTKEHVRDLLDGAVRVVASPASWNNATGLSRALNERLQPDTEVFVAEMGTYGPGEIRAMCSWLPPDVAVITAVGPVHLERMRTLDGIAAAKAEILERAPVAVLAVDDPRLARLAAEHEARGTTVWRAHARTTADALPSRPRDVVAVAAGETVTVHAGGHAVGTASAQAVHPVNVACAVAAALALDVPRDVVARGLGRLGAARHRAEVQSAGGLVVVDDTFNSNPAGAALALERLVRAVPDGRRAVVTPGMVELGAEQAGANRELARKVAAAGATLVIVGWTNRRALRAGAPDGAVTVAHRDAARVWVRSHLGPGDGVLWENDLPDHYP